LAILLEYWLMELTVWNCFENSSEAGEVTREQTVEGKMQKGLPSPGSPDI
jgi:hypothetical protein